MAMEIKQVHKLSQQLVMTPQLQQAIKLLQLSRMELVDLVREEMMENPVLEDDLDTQSELSRDDPQAKEESQLQGETEMEAPSVEARDQAVPLTHEDGFRPGVLIRLVEQRVADVVLPGALEPAIAIGFVLGAGGHFGTRVVRC